MIEIMQMTRIYPKERTSTDEPVSAGHRREVSGQLAENSLCQFGEPLRKFNLDGVSALPVNLANEVEIVCPNNREALQSNSLGQVYSS